jgi:Ulp1 family protease
MSFNFKQPFHDILQDNLIYCQLPSGHIDVILKDYDCLKEKTWLNDTIIDFYLKWFQDEKMSEKYKQGTHIFSAQFYKALIVETSSQPQAQIPFLKLKNWTKHVNLFEKDFIVVPICENHHWFVAVICFPTSKKDDIF